MANTADTPFTLNELNVLSEVREATVAHRRVKWAHEGDLGVIVEGVARNFTDADGNHFDWNRDVREAHLWISGTMEHFLPVSTILAQFTDGTFVVTDN